MTTIAKEFGVTDNAVRKWAQNYEIRIPRRLGYWAKQRSIDQLEESSGREPEMVSVQI